MTDFIFESPRQDSSKKNAYAMHNQESEYKQGSKYRMRYRGNNSMNDENNNDSSFESIETDQIQKSAKKQGDLEQDQVKFGVKLDWYDQSDSKSNKMKSTTNKSVGIGDQYSSNYKMRSNNNKLLTTPSRLFTSCGKNYLETPNGKMANQVNYLRQLQSNQGQQQVIISPYSRRLFQDNSDDEEKQPKEKLLQQQEEQEEEEMSIENQINNNNNCDKQKIQNQPQVNQMKSALQKKIDQSYDIPLNKNNKNIEQSKEQELITTKKKIFNETEASTSVIKNRALEQMISNGKFKVGLFDAQKEVKFPFQAAASQNENNLFDGTQLDHSCRLTKQFSVLSIMSNKNQGSTVRRCECLLTGDQYAIKSIYLGTRIRENDNKIELLKQFWTYAPGLLRVKSLWISENYLFLVTPLCRGNLIHLKSSLKANQPLLIQLISDICSALDFLHQKGYSHCNIKLENILLQKNKFKLADFGLSSLQPMSSIPTQNLSSNLQNNIFSEDQNDDILQFGRILSQFIEEQPQQQIHTSQQEISHLLLVNIIRLMINPDKKQRPSARDILDKLPSCPGIQQSKQFVALFQENQILKQKIEQLQQFQDQTVIKQNKLLH